jgi:acylphosphatase
MKKSAFLLFAALAAASCFSASGADARKDPASRPASASAPATTSAPAARAVHVFVSGKVQGVGFRAWAVAEATKLKLTGWVKNLTDGRVEAVMEGPSDAVASMLEKMKKGPASGRVDDLKSTDETPTGQFKTFEQK